MCLCVCKIDPKTIYSHPCWEGCRGRVQPSIVSAVVVVVGMELGWSFILLHFGTGDGAQHFTMLGKSFATEQHPNSFCIASVTSIHSHTCGVASVQAWGAILEPPDWQHLPFPLSSVWGVWGPPREEAVRLGSYIQMWRWESRVNGWDLKSTFLLCLFVCVYKHVHTFSFVWMHVWIHACTHGYMNLQVHGWHQELSSINIFHPNLEFTNTPSLWLACAGDPASSWDWNYRWSAIP